MALYVLFSLYFAGYILLFLFTLFNITVYIVPMKMGYPQIWGFYLIVITIYTLVSIEMGNFIFTRTIDRYADVHDFEEESDDDRDIGVICCTISD